MSDSNSYVCTISQRLDLFLAEQMGQTRSQIAQLIKQDCIFIDGKKETRPGAKLKQDQEVSVVFPDAKNAPALEVDFAIEVLYEDEDVLVINKPSGVTVHPAPSVKEATLVDWLKHKGVRLSTISGEERHGIVHRLDKGTSGAMVIAKNNEAHEFLSLQLQDKTMGRYYIAAITPPLKEEETVIEKSIGRSTHNRLKMACVQDNHGKSAKTVFRSLALSEDEKSQLVACKLFTGRTHQIRVHLESINRHIIGDHIYALSPKAEKSERILLHAYMIYFIHPLTREKLFFTAKLDDVMQKSLENKFTMETTHEIMDSDRILRSFSAAL